MTVANTDDVGGQVLWLCRHGNRIDWVDPTWEGTDPHLAADGVVQAIKTGQRLRGQGIRHIFCSPFLRTIETAHHIAAALELTVKVEHGATEWLRTDWFPTPPEYAPPDLLHKRFPGIDTTYRSIGHPVWPEATWEDVKARCVTVARDILATFGSDVLIVGHSASVGGMALGLFGSDFELPTDFCSLTKVICSPGGVCLELKGDISHLKEDLR